MMELFAQALAEEGLGTLLDSFWFVAGGVSGFLVSRFTRSQADKDVQGQRLFENATRLVAEKDRKYIAFTESLTKAAIKLDNEELTLNDFHEVSSAADLYFAELRNVANACLSGAVSSNDRDRSFVPALKEATENSLPKYYEVLPQLAGAIGVEYCAELKRSNYESIYDAVEKFG